MLLVPILREGLTLLARQPKHTWWVPDDHFKEAEERQPIGLSQLDSCIKQLWYKAHGEEPSDYPDPAMNLVWWLGNFMENTMVRAFEAAGLPIRGAQTTITWNGLPGHIDGTFWTNDHPALIKALGPDKKFLIEFKSSKPEKLKQAMKKGSREIFPGYYNQEQTYLVAWENTLGEKLDGAFLVVANKSASFPGGASEDAFYEEMVPPDPVGATAQMNYVMDQAVNNPLKPRRPYAKQMPLCPFCPFFKKCWEDPE